VDHDQIRSRARENKKKRMNQLMIVLLIIALVIFLFLVIPLLNKSDTNDSGSHNDNEQTEQNETNNENSDETENNSNKENQNTNNEENNNSNENDSNDENEIPPITEADESDQIEVDKDSDDENVIASYTAAWQPIKTTQTGEHNSVFDEGSADRNEIGQAITKVTSFSEDEYVLWWIGNDGFNKAYTDIEHKESGQLYRIYYDWIDNEGWQVTKVNEIVQSEHKS